MYHLRNSEIKDEKNRLKKVEIEIQLPEINHQNIKVNIQTDLLANSNIKGQSKALFSIDSKEILFRGVFNNGEGVDIGEYYFKKMLNEDIYEEGLKSKNLTYEKIWEVDEGEIIIDGKKGLIKKVKVSIPLKNTIIPMIVKSKGNPKILVRSEDDNLNKLITDNQLRGIIFKDDGEILFNGAKP